MPTINSTIARIGGSANLSLKIKDGKLDSVAVQHLLGKRDIAGLMHGRKPAQVPLIASRICGMCSASHHLASIIAVEKALGITPSDSAVALRQLLNIGEFISSHAFHISWLVLPDYYNCHSVHQMLQKHRKEVDMGIALRNSGLALKRFAGSREIHPLGMMPGGSLVKHKEKDVESLRLAVSSSVETAQKLAETVAVLDTEFFARKTDYACSTRDAYPLLDGDIVTLSGTNGQAESLAGLSLMTGALARMNCMSQGLSQQARRSVKSNRVIFPNYNPFMNNFCQAVEIIHYLNKAEDILKNFRYESGIAEAAHSEGRGIAAVESPKGLIIHDYLFEAGRLKDATIMASSDWNIKNMHEDLAKFLPRFMKQSKDNILLEAGKLIRAYDPCACSVR